MLPLYSALEFLTVGQAVSLASQTLKQSVSLEDLLTLCETDACRLFIDLAPGTSGFVQISSVDSLCEEVFCAGRQLVHSVRKVRRARPGVSIEITVAGPVFLGGSSFQEFTKVWSCQVDVDTVELRFRTDDIVALAETLQVPPEQFKDIGRREQDNYDLVVAALALVAGVDLKKPFAAYAALEAAAAGRVGIPSQNTVAKILGRAAQHLQ